MGRKTSRRKRENQMVESGYMGSNVVELEPRRKKWSMHDVKSLRPLTETQRQFFHAWFEGSHLCGYGSAGTGKSFISTYLALTSLFSDQENVSKIVFVRSAVATRAIGHLPGTLEEKQAVYEQPYKDILQELMGRASTYDDMKQAGKIEFMLTSHVRGLTWDNCVVIVDEAQNMTYQEIHSIITRLGAGSRLILIGDLRQTDLNKYANDREGFSKAMKIMETMPSVELVNFLPTDIVRSKFVREWIIASEDFDEG